MLIRFVVNNMLSFGKEMEFNTLPSPRYSRMNEHKYVIGDISVLKLSSIYGANGAGKSNIVKLLQIFKEIILKEQLPLNFKNMNFKLGLNDQKSQILAIEFFQDDITFSYAIEVLNNVILREELHKTCTGKEQGEVVFERKTLDNGNTLINFFEEFYLDEENKVLKNVIEKNLSKQDKPIFKLLTTLNNPSLKDVAVALKWFINTLVIIHPNSKPVAIAHKIDIDSKFNEYAEEIMCSFNVGICGLRAEKKDLNEFFGDDKPEELAEIIKVLNEKDNSIDQIKSNSKLFGLTSNNGNEIVIVKENGKILVKQVKFEHERLDGGKEIFNLEEESDGTIRLLDFIPAFKDIVSEKKVYIIDEIERSIHPLLIKELLNKFSSDDKTNGQLIFTTHEANLLDQEIFRQDEIWFVEKDKNGCSDLYSLSDFKNHHTIDIRKGYLTGRYGAIPFLANLQDLNWHKDDSEK